MFTRNNILALVFVLPAALVANGAESVQQIFKVEICETSLLVVQKHVRIKIFF